mmetsp:Transcript_43017/g.133718  ORF Transcript_43017/g.133718 Transcript_43017/m.133718 type:complete len:235 (-) Transcript_43017:170-874(-)
MPLARRDLRSPPSRSSASLPLLVLSLPVSRQRLWYGGVLNGAQRQQGTAAGRPPALLVERQGRQLGEALRAEHAVHLPEPRAGVPPQESLATEGPVLLPIRVPQRREGAEGARVEAAAALAVAADGARRLTSDASRAELEGALPAVAAHPQPSLPRTGTRRGAGPSARAILQDGAEAGRELAVRGHAGLLPQELEDSGAHLALRHAGVLAAELLHEGVHVHGARFPGCAGRSGG